jgi:hypothetical protein
MDDGGEEIKRSLREGIKGKGKDPEGVVFRLVGQ